MSLVLAAYSLKLQVQNSEYCYYNSLIWADFSMSQYVCYSVVLYSYYYVFNFLFWLLDILNPVEVPSQGDRQNFTLSVSASDEIQLNARELNWYINGNLITNSSDNLLTNGNKTLTTIGIPGLYEVRHDGLLKFPRYHECEKMLLSGMRHYPMFRPVRFLVNTTGIENHIHNIILIIILFMYN